MKVVAAVVDADSWKANWSENDSEDGGVDNTGYMKSLTTIRWSILYCTGMIDIGRKSDGMHDDATLATGRIEARFHWFGTTADEMDRFVMSVSGLANIRAPIRKNHAGSSSKPVALGFSLSRIVNILHSVMCTEASWSLTICLTAGAM